MIAPLRWKALEPTGANRPTKRLSAAGYLQLDALGNLTDFLITVLFMLIALPRGGAEHYVSGSVS